jgi:hypothetical protein
MTGQAYAKEATANYGVFSPDPFAQQDNTWRDGTDVIGNLPTGFTSIRDEWKS